MKHRVAAMSVCAAAALALTMGVAGQESQSPQPPKTQEVSLTGCLVQGSGPSVFVFENAKANPSDMDEKGRSYLLATDEMSISFREHLNHEVQIEGSAETMMPPIPLDGQKVKESDLPKLTATKVTHVATTCSQPSI
jgi:hypothetical protein